jgi:hypothetical protein
MEKEGSCITTNFVTFADRYVLLAEMEEYVENL